MKGLPRLNTIYAWAFFVLLLCAAASAYALGIFPAGLVVAIIACSALDLAVKKFLKKSLSFPSSAAITGIIIGSIAPIDAPVAFILLASSAAIASKYLLRLDRRHIFNPAALGMLFSLALFGLGDVWWAAAASVKLAGISFPLALLLVIPNYRALKLVVSLPFLAAIAVAYAATRFVAAPLAASGLFNLFGSLPFYFAFIMLSEPKTSPNAVREQLVFGIAAAAAVFALDYAHVRYSFLIALLAANLAYAIFRAVKK